MSTDHLLNIREAAEYLGVGERVIKEMVDSGILPAYRLGGSFLRFKESQLIISRETIYKRLNKETPHPSKVLTAGKTAAAEYSESDELRDFFYFNDFYIISVIIIAIAIFLMMVT